MKKLLLFTLGLIFAGLLNAQQSESYSTSTDAIFGNEREIYFKFNCENKQQQDALGQIVAISKVKGAEVFAYAGKKQFINFLEQHIPYQVLPYPRPIHPKMFTKSSSKQIMSWDSYPTYSAYVSMMAQFAIDYPTLCDIDTILDHTTNNHRILVAHISSNVNTPANKPQFLYTSSIHGNELTGYVLLLHLADYLLSNYGTIARVTALLNNVDIWICPLANPDGTFNPSDNDISSAHRGNYSINSQTGTYFDLNRNYPDPRTGNPTTDGPIQPETQAFMNFAAQHHFNASVNFHDGSELINYPWDTWDINTNNHPHPDDAWWQRISRSYADTVHLNNGALGSSYFSDMNNGITNGGNWYIIEGGRQDYMNYFHHCREMTIELSYDQPPAGASLPDYWNAQYRSMIKFIEESENGIRGIITDSCSGQPIRAKVFVNSHDVITDSSFVYSALPVGNYHRPLINGTYSLTYSAPGYQSKTITGIVVNNGSATIRNIVLRPTSLPNADFTSDVVNTCSGIVNFTNLSSSNSSSYLWKFGDGSTSTQNNPTHIYTSDGTYTVVLIASNCIGIDSIVNTSYINVALISTTNLVNDTTCGPGTVNLSAQSTGTVRWFDAAMNGTLLNTGNSYSPAITTTTTFYAEGSVLYPQQSAGKLDNTGPSGGYNSSGDHYLVFDCLNDLILDSVTIYGNPSTTPGNKTIELRTSTGAVLQSVTVSIASGVNKVYLGFNLPVANNLRLACTSGANLFRHNTGGLGYPYTITNLISVTTCDQGTNYYYYLFNWRVHKPGCTGARVPVYGVVTPTAAAGFTSVVNNAVVDFTNTSTNATAWYWDFGDGNSSNLQNPSHTYASAGNFNVKLVAYGCNADSVTLPVTITVIGVAANESFGNLSVSPNPAKDMVYINCDGSKEKLTVELFSITGAKVYAADYSNYSGIIGIDISRFEQGIYLLKLSNSKGNAVKRIVKI
ncbi:MAG: M14 family zinc carboxypeptidase [Bacteroidota bacterium]